MRASLRWKTILQGGLLLVPATALAQSAPDPASNTPATDAVGPQELQNFSLPGNVTKPADQQSAPAPTAAAPSAKAQPDPAQTAAAPALRTAPPQQQRRQSAAASKPSSAVAPIAQPPVQSSVTNLAPQLNAAPAANATPADTPAAPTSFPATPVSAAPTGTLAPEHKLLIWPWLLAALVLAGATFFLLWRRRPQQALAGGPQFDLFVPPDPAPAPPRPAPTPPRAAEPPVAPAPQPAPAPPKPAAPASTGIVSKRLRPSLEIAVQPLRCVVEDERVTLEFEFELYNSGTAPARAVLAEASLLNAGANQDQELAAFFANPLGAGERLDAIPPMKRMTFTSQVVAPRNALQEYELGGRKVFVPVLAFNALYLWSGGHAQTSAAYLVGRDTNGDKLGPLSLDRGPRQIGKLAAHLLPAGLRT
jgi:hypothetical protein